MLDRVLTTLVNLIPGFIFDPIAHQIEKWVVPDLHDVVCLDCAPQMCD